MDLADYLQVYETVVRLSYGFVNKFRAKIIGFLSVMVKKT